MRPPPLHVCLNWKRSLTAFWRFDHKGLLGCDQFSIHCTGTYSDELLTPGFDPERPRSTDLWTYGIAQIFSTVSPAMHKEFWLDYAVDWFERSGVLRLLRTSARKDRTHSRGAECSQDLNESLCRREVGAERIGGDFVFFQETESSAVGCGYVGCRRGGTGPHSDLGSLRLLRVSRRTHPQGHQHCSPRTRASLGVGAHRARSRAVRRRCLRRPRRVRLSPHPAAVDHQRCAVYVTSRV